MSRKRRAASTVFVAGIVLYAAGGWALYELLGPRLIEALYRGEGPSVLTRLLESRDTIPLETYQARGRTLFLGLHLFLVWIATCALLHARYRLIDRTPALFPRKTMVIALAAFLFAPVVILKFVLASAFLAVASLRRPLTWSAPRVSLGLLTLWGSTFLLVPIWASVSRGLWFAVFLIVAGIVWSTRAAGEVRLRASTVTPLSLLVLAGGTLLLNYRALLAPIAWRGDEGYHIAIVLTLVQNPFWLAALVAAMLAIGWGRTGSPEATIRLLIVLAVTFVLVGQTYGDQIAAAVRYPFASRWLQALPLQFLVAAPSLIRSEGLFRLVPLAAAVLIAAVVLSRLQSWPALAWLTAAAVATTPLILYYTSILYLEMPAVLLALVVMLSLRDILETNPLALRRSGAWLALLALGFIKETMVPFLAAVMVSRSAYQLWRARSASRDLSRLREVEVILLAFAPLAVYLAFRAAGGAPREYGFAVANIFSAEPYIYFMQSWREQAPALAVFFLAGTVFLVLVGEINTIVVAWLAVLASAAFIAGDTPTYAGYSRFNLPALPAMLALAVVALRRIAAARPRLAHTIPILWLAVNAFSFPIHADGSRVAQWGSRAADTADYTYPYREALAWIRDHYPDARLFATGLDYPYSYDFYFRLLRWQPAFRMHLIPPPPVSADEEIAAFFEEARREKALVVLYHVRAEDRAPGNRVGSYELEQVFANRANRLLLYRAVAPRS